MDYMGRDGRAKASGKVEMCQELPIFLPSRPCPSPATWPESGDKAAICRSPGERGQTLILVAVAMVSLLAMAALAIDVVTLYVARGEMQRAADAAALGAAKAFVDSGITSDPGNITRQNTAQLMGQQLIVAILPLNKVSGQAPVQAPGSPVFDFTRQGNPQVTVTLQRTDLPTFFARIWGRKLSTVSATAVAEAYNPYNALANYPPITPRCVKPIMVTNVANQFLDPAFVPTPALIGTQITLTPCGGGGCGTSQFRPAVIDTATPKLCPACQGVSDYENGIECCDTTVYACGTAATPVSVDTTMSAAGLMGARTNLGVQCMTNNPAQDTLNPANLTAGTGPPEITAGSGPQSGTLVTTSRSIATLPIIDSPINTTVHVIGFLQVFVDMSTPTNVTAHILNVVGCGNPGTGAAVLGGGYSPIPVRLIHN
jgi:Putative Flp pilus-assembly TadE/G-like